MINYKNKPEILAPCGSYEILIAAVKAGADACYIGGDRFGARAYATNLSKDSIVKAIDFAHTYDAKLYLTVNTLFKSHEIKELYEYLLPYYNAGIDAVIVQDLGVFSLVKKAFPDLPIHCSTQMNITSIHGARLMKECGAERIVTAREMSLEQIRYIKENVDIELEVFVHGAMCYSYSGQCLMSSMAGGRSGNRGRCAQPCRKCYGQDYILSMKDMCSLTNLPKLIDSGIDSLKIEGRMKNEYYVASAVSAYKEIRDDYIDGNFSMKRAEELKYTLANVFNRGGFCDGYFFVHNGPDMISKNRPNNQGVCIGKILDVQNGKIKLKLYDDLYKHDVLEVVCKNGDSIDITSGLDGSKGEVITLNAPKTKYISSGQEIFRTRCNKLLDEIYSKSINIDKRIPITGEFYGITGQPMTLTVKCINDGELFYGTSVLGTVEESKNKQIDKEQIRQKLSQLGNTSYYFQDLSMDVSEDAFIPAGMLKQLRRDAIEQLQQNILDSYKRNKNIDYKSEKNINISGEENHVVSVMDIPVKIGVTSYNHAIQILKYDWISGVYMSVSLYRELDEKNVISQYISKQIKIYIELPYIVDNDFDIISYLPNSNINGIYIRNIDGFSAYKENMQKLKEYDIILASSLYGYNNEARSYFAKSDHIIFELPKELNKKECESLFGKGEMTIYEYQQVMLSSQCVQKNKDQCDKANKVVEIKDDMGNVFYSRSVCSECCNVVHNGTPLYMADKLDVEFINKCCINNLRVNFTIEKEKELNYIMELIEKSLRGEKMEQSKNKFTTGHYNRGVE